MIQAYNTLAKKRELLPKLGSKIRMFVCGPTVYDYIHIGNARTFVVFDVIAKYLRYRGYDLKYIQNITDMDDKIIDRAKETGTDPKKLAEKFEKIFLDNVHDLKVDSVDEYPRATNHIKEIIKQVKTLIKKGHAYLIEGDGYYFDLKTFPEYGKLSGRTAEMAEDAVSRIDESVGKRNRGDFCLWKLAVPVPKLNRALSTKGQESMWDFETGDLLPKGKTTSAAGRPGWHIEDTAITEKYFGPQYEIHGGGQDLIFPHHEAEIAQQESASGLKPFVKYWLHTGFLVNKGGKMSKSLGGFLTVEEALKKYSPEALRFYFLSAHYRSPLDYTDNSIRTAEAATNRLAETVEKLKSIKERDDVTEKSAEDIASSSWESIENQKKNFEEAMDDDFNTQMAIGHIFSLIGRVNHFHSLGSINLKGAVQLMRFLKEINKILGIIPSTTPLLPQEVKSLIKEREEAREKKDFAVSDELRKQIENLGYEVDDTVYGPLVKKVG